jgi:hypothetical protein
MFYVYRNVADIGSACISKTHTVEDAIGVMCGVLRNVVTRHHYAQRIDIVSDDFPDPILVVKIGGDVDVTFIDR